tara:strand:- start:5890 stop:6678 length:789 start_codon:yes stop_codon:yes gene_type:complete
MFKPVIPVAGLAGWRFLQKTYDTQFETFSRSTELKRDTEYFDEKIGSITSAQELVSDRQLLTVALGAFGLQDDINNRYFIQKILEEGTTSDDALANRLSDTRYRELSEAFGFGPSEFLKVGEPGFVEAVISRFQANSFEVAAGEQSDAMRVALYAQRELAQIAERDSSTDAKWFAVLGDPPMRKLFEKALGLPTSIGQIDIDQQLTIFKDRAFSVFGSDKFDQFLDQDTRQDVLTKFIVRDQIDSLGAGLSSNSIALTLLQS